MSYPAETKSIRVRNRFIELLNRIVKGEEFFSTTGVVYDRWKNWKQRDDYPAYSVFFGPTKEWQEMAGMMAMETLILIVKGAIRNEEDAPAQVRRCLRDVRKAVMDDMISGGAGSLQELCKHLTIGSAATDNGDYASEGYGYFDQEFEVTIYGAIEEL